MKLKRLKNLLGVGPHLLILGIIFEGLTIFIRRWISFPIKLNFVIQLSLSVFFLFGCLVGMVWFQRSLNLKNIYFYNDNNKLITKGPFNYVRHPLYTTLLLSTPQLMIIWFKDLLFVIPWVILFILAHYVVIAEERELIKIFGKDYENYQKFVPALFPFKGAGGKLYREHHIIPTQETVPK